jgi:hypothetical protein
MTDNEIKLNVTEKAIKYGVPSEHSSLFDNLDEEFKIDFYNSIRDKQFGLPILRFSHSNGFWVLIGTKELAWFDNDKIQFVKIKDIERYEALDKEEAKNKESDPMLVKFQMERLGLITKDNRRIELCIEKNKEFFSFQHMMIRIMKLIQ